MNTFEQRMDRLQKRFDEINAMSFADVDQRLSTLPPLRCGTDIESPIADAIRQQGLTGDPSKNVAEWDWPGEVDGWDTNTGGGVYTVVGYAPMQIVAERVTNIMLANKTVVVIGEDEGTEELFPDGWCRFRSDVGDDLSDQEYALQLRDEIATQPIGAVVLLNQKGKTQFLDVVTAVPVFRGNKVAMTKRLPIFDVDTELATWNDDTGRIEFKKDIFAKVEKPGKRPK